MIQEDFLKQLQEKHKLEEVDLKEYKKIDKKGMHFLISAYRIEGVGYLSILTMKAMFGIMKMHSIILTPQEKDAPLFSYDAIQVGKKSTLILELYDLEVVEPEEKVLLPLDEVKEKYKDLPVHAMDAHWYDSLKYKESASYSGKKIQERIDAFSKEYFQKYVEILDASSEVDKTEKRKKVAVYVDGLLNNGGPAVNQFIKMIGKEKTEYLFRHHIFNTVD